MITLSVSVVPVNGCIEIPLVNKQNGYIGILDISLPRIENQEALISISCDQVDSTIYNRKRILRAFYIRTVYEASRAYVYQQFEHITYHKLDSSDDKLTIRIRDQHGALKFAEDTLPVMITMELKLDPADKWINM